MGNLCGNAPKSRDLHRSVKTKYELNGQGHVLKYYDGLNEAQKKQLLGDLDSFNPGMINDLYNDLVKKSGKDAAAEDDKEVNLERIDQDFVYSAEGQY